jgi:nitrogen regulatory protein P-II 1
MKEIRAYIQPYMLNNVIQALRDIPDFPGMSISDCEGFGHEPPQENQDYKLFFSKKRIEIFAPDELVDVIFDTLMKIAHTGNHGDGKVYILEVLKGGQIRSAKRGQDVS